MTEQELLVDCLRRLNRAEITYYLTGSMARNYWGIPRTTHEAYLTRRLATITCPLETGPRRIF